MRPSLMQEKLKNIDMHYTHPSYTLERKMLAALGMGHLEDTLATLKTINALERPKLARDSIRSMKNSLIGSCTLFTRAAIEAGIDPEDAFSLSDVFIKYIESLDAIPALEQSEYDMARSFVKLVNEAKVYHYPYPISKVIKYIYENASERITLTQLSELTQLSSDYLSKLFHKEVGLTLSAYMQIQKIEMAKNFLEFTDLSVTEIANLLTFSNPGHLSSVFKKHTQLTPLAYRQSLGQKH